jgi:hypothetical protein
VARGALAAALRRLRWAEQFYIGDLGAAMAALPERVTEARLDAWRRREDFPAFMAHVRDKMHDGKEREREGRGAGQQRRRRSADSLARLRAPTQQQPEAGADGGGNFLCVGASLF